MICRIFYDTHSDWCEVIPHCSFLKLNLSSLGFAGFSLLCGLLSSCGKRGLPWNCRLLVVGASLVVEQGLQGTWGSVLVGHELSSCGSQPVEHRCNSCEAWAQLLLSMWALPDQGLNLFLLIGRWVLYRWASREAPHWSFDLHVSNNGDSPVAQLVKNPPAMQETPVWFLGREDPLEEG